MLRSKSWTSSKTAVQLKTRCCCSPAPWEKEPSSEVVWRGPAANAHVTLSVSPPGWQELQLDHALLLQRARPVWKKRAPCAASSSAGSVGGVVDSTVVKSDWVDRSTTPRRRLCQQDR